MWRVFCFPLYVLLAHKLKPLFTCYKNVKNARQLQMTKKKQRKTNKWGRKTCKEQEKPMQLHGIGSKEKEMRNGGERASERDRMKERGERVVGLGCHVSIFGSCMQTPDKSGTRTSRIHWGSIFGEWILPTRTVSLPLCCPLLHSLVMKPKWGCADSWKEIDSPQRFITLYNYDCIKYTHYHYVSLFVFLCLARSVFKVRSFEYMRSSLLGVSASSHLLILYMFFW